MAEHERYDSPSTTRLTRKRFLEAAGAAGASMALSSAVVFLASCETSPNQESRASGSPAQSVEPEVQAFRSRPDLKPPAIDVIRRTDEVARGYVFVAPKNGPEEHSPAQDGALILDDRGRVVWFRPLQDEEQDVMDFKVQRYRGRPVLTFWEGVHGGHGQGEYIILDTFYREVARVRAGNGYEGDHHEFLITPQDTALLTIYDRVEDIDLSAVGGPKGGAVLDGIVQEVDIESGQVLFEWHSLEHVGFEESYSMPPQKPKAAFDYFHINSIDVDYDNNLLVSARRTSAVYKVDRVSGEVIWRLGGKRSDFEMGPGTRIALQHDARRRPDGTITIFDNGSPDVSEHSRAVVIRLDDWDMIAELEADYAHPDGKICGTQGNAQVLPNSNLFVGWGSNPRFTEFTKGGELAFDASFPAEVESYRAYRFEWEGHPVEEGPALVAHRDSGVPGEVTLYVSWNGATEVARWEAFAGGSPGELRPVGAAPSEGFETTMKLEVPAGGYLVVRASDGSGRLLGASKVIQP